METTEMNTSIVAATSASVPTIHAAIAPERPRFVPITEGPSYLPFSINALRDLKFKAHDRKNSRGETIKGNGTGPAGVWVQIGAKVLIDLDALDRWIESHKVRAAK